MIDLKGWYDDNPVIFYWKTRKDFIMENTKTFDELLAELDACRGRNGYLYWEEIPESFEPVDIGEWVQEHKYQYQECIIKHKPTDRYFLLITTRWGDYYSGFECDRTEIVEVERVEEKQIVIKYYPITPIK